MENNRFNKHYSKISVDDLLAKLLSHEIKESSLDKEWYEALKIHLAERELDEDAKKLFEKILNTDSDVLKREKHERDSVTKNSIELEINSSNGNISKSSIIASGKSLKNIVYTSIIWTFCSIFGLFISIYSKDFETTKNIYITLGIVTLLCNILILNSLYTAGNHLENS